MYKFSGVILLVVFLITGCISTQNNKVTLSGGIIDVINQSVVEVVIPNPLLLDDPIIYEYKNKTITSKDLPFHLIPYKVRTDKYIPLGTAFAVSETELVTGAHVTFLDNQTQWPQLYIRDVQGKVYEFDQILKYSDHMDYVVFTARGFKTSRFLNTARPVINEQVFSVGNAYGEGIIIREGNFTSTTPEELNGEWEWLRFSAAASYGNSGGPLLNTKGDIIGIILRKSENENLNFALPISLALEAEPVIKVFKRVKYTLPILQSSELQDQTFETAPGHYLEIRETLSRNKAERMKSLLDALLENNRDSIFPNGKGSLPMLYDLFTMTFPGILGEKDDGTWTLYSPSKDVKSQNDLGDNGFLTTGKMGPYLFYYLKKPDTVSLKEIHSNTVLQMDYILKATKTERVIGSENVGIKSIGEPVKSEVVVDSYKRKWQMSIWNLLFNDTQIVTFSLPTPRGVIGFLCSSNTSELESEYVQDMKAQLNFMYMSFYANLKEWTEYLENKEILPEVFSNIRMSYTPGKDFSFQSDSFKIAYDSSLMEISDESDMSLRFTFFPGDGEVVWDLMQMGLGENENSGTYFAVRRELNPEEGLPEDFFDDWEKLYKERHPYNGEPYFDDGMTYISGLHALSAAQENKEDLDELYIVNYIRDGKVDDEVMISQFGKVNNCISF